MQETGKNGENANHDSSTTGDAMAEKEEELVQAGILLSLSSSVIEMCIEFSPFKHQIYACNIHSCGHKEEKSNFSGTY